MLHPLPDNSQNPLYEAIVSAWSMANFNESAWQSGHDHFFATFPKFDLASTHTGDMIAEARNRAAGDNLLYLELMFGIGSSKAAQLGDAVWGPGRPEPAVADLGAYYDALLASPNWNSVMEAGTNLLNTAEARANGILGCGAAGTGGAQQPGCNVSTRYLYQTTRTKAPHQVFAQFVAAFEIAKRDARIVGMNLVAPEDHPVALRDYELQMSMLSFLHERYRDSSPLHIALHAGELTSAVLPPERTDHLTFHIRRAVEVGHAERIGHGVDVLGEADSGGLRAELRERGVLVEACLSSNLAILGVSGAEHPLSAYLADGVPVSLATDDPGVSRSNMTQEYVRAAVDQRVEYSDLKRMARNSLEHAFLPGESLWRSLNEGVVADACAGDVTGSNDPSETCRSLLTRSERARMQWELERRFALFEF